MSYDIYFYNSVAETPTVDEAVSIIEEEISVKNAWDKRQMANALLNIADNLELFDGNACIELSSKEGHLPLQIMIDNAYITITVPYGCSQKESAILFKSIHNYLRKWNEIINNLIVYDPQMDQVFTAQSVSNLNECKHIYDATVRKLYPAENKKWWQIW